MLSLSMQNVRLKRIDSLVIYYTSYYLLVIVVTFDMLVPAIPPLLSA